VNYTRQRYRSRHQSEAHVFFVLRANPDHPIVGSMRPALGVRLTTLGVTLALCDLHDFLGGFMGDDLLDVAQVIDFMVGAVGIEPTTSPV
jgi:hypothetical protein